MHSSGWPMLRSMLRAGGWRLRSKSAVGRKIQRGASPHPQPCRLEIDAVHVSECGAKLPQNPVGQILIAADDAREHAIVVYREPDVERAIRAVCTRAERLEKTA